MKKDLLICGSSDDCDTLKKELNSLYDLNISTIYSSANFYPLSFIRRHVKDSDVLLIDIEDYNTNTYSVISFALAYDVEIVGYYKGIAEDLKLQLVRACDFVKYIDDLEEYFG